MENNNRNQSKKLSQLVLNTPRKLNQRQSYIRSSFGTNPNQDLKKPDKQNIEQNNNVLHADYVDHISTFKQNPPKKPQSDPLYLKYLQLCEALVKNNHTIAQIYIQPSNVSKILKHDSVCIEQLTVTLIQSNKTSYEDAAYQLQKILKAFKIVMEILKDKMMGLDRWLQSITFKKKQDQNVAKEGKNQKGVLDKCTLCECYLTERKIKQVYSELSQKPKLLVPTVQQSYIGIEDQDSDDQRQKLMIRKTISNFKNEGQRLINSKAAKADSYLSALIEQETDRSHDIMDFLKKNEVSVRAPHSRGIQVNNFSYDSQLNQKKLIFNKVIEQMALKIKKFISAKFSKKFEQLTNLMKEKSVEMMAGNQRESQISSQKNSDRFEKTLHFQLNDKIIKVKQAEHQNLIIQKNQLQKQVSILRENSIKMQSSRKSLQILCKNLSMQKARLQENCESLEKDKQALISKFDSKITVENQMQTLPVYFYSEDELIKLFKQFTKKGTKSLLAYLNRKHSLNSSLASKITTPTIQQDNFGENINLDYRNSRDQNSKQSSNELPEIPEFSGKHRRGSQRKNSISKNFKRKNSSAGFTLQKRTSNRANENSLKTISMKSCQSDFNQKLKQKRRQSKDLFTSANRILESSEIRDSNPNSNSNLNSQNGILSQNRNSQGTEFKRIKKINRSYFGKEKSKIKTQQSQSQLQLQSQNDKPELETILNSENKKIQCNRSQTEQNQKMSNFCQQLQRIRSQNKSRKGINFNEPKQQQRKKIQKMFNASDLDLFGGFSQAFSNGNSMLASPNISLTLNEQKMANRMNEFIFSLGNFKNKSVFESTISFLYKPYETVSNGQIFYTIPQDLPYASLKISTLQKVKNIIFIHKNCDHTTQVCSHLRVFLDKLGVPKQ